MRPLLRQRGQSPLSLALGARKFECALALVVAGAKADSSLASVVEDDACAEVVFEAVTRDRTLPYRSVDAKGRPAINIATGECRRRILEALFLLGRYELLDEKHRSATCVVLFARDHGGGQAPRGNKGGGGA